MLEFVGKRTESTLGKTCELVTWQEEQPTVHLPICLGTSSQRTRCKEQDAAGESASDSLYVQLKKHICTRWVRLRMIKVFFGCT